MYWSAKPSCSWLSCSPSSGKNNGEITFTVNSSGLSVGKYNKSINISCVGRHNPSFISVYLNIYDMSASPFPFGYQNYPDNSKVQTGTIQVSGWALDDIGVDRVEIKRLPVNDPPQTIGSDGLVFIGNAVFVEGSRPDIEELYPDYPNCDRAGWGYSLATTGLPNQGNGCFTLVSIAYDKDGHRSELARSTINCYNGDSVPFGEIETPVPDATVSGDDVESIGWILTPQPHSINLDQPPSILMIMIDSVQVYPIQCYGIHREDIGAKYPGYINSDNCGIQAWILSTQFENGAHNISWYAVDTNGDSAEIGNRFITIDNPPVDPGDSIGLTRNRFHQTEIRDGKILKLVSHLDELPERRGGVFIKKGFFKSEKALSFAPDSESCFNITIGTSDRVVVYLTPDMKKSGENKDDSFAGVSKVGENYRRLPIGSTLDAKKGIFYWRPGPGFYGDFKLIFIDKEKKEKIGINIRVGEPGKSSLAEK